jgi:Protein of unknown function (DUF998)
MESSLQFRILGLLGAIAPVIYLVATALGGFLWTGYSPYSETVSTLTSSSAPHANILNPLFATYNLFVILLAFGLYLGVKPKKPLLGSTLLSIAGIGGLVLYWFPQDFPITPQMSFTGTMHVVFAAVIAFSSIAAMAAYGIALRKVPNWSKIGKLCLIWLPIAFVLGGFGAASITAPYAGLAERLSIGSILLWIEVMAITLIKKQ